MRIFLLVFVLVFSVVPNALCQGYEDYEPYEIGTMKDLEIEGLFKMNYITVAEGITNAHLSGKITIPANLVVEELYVEYVIFSLTNKSEITKVLEIVKTDTPNVFIFDYEYKLDLLLSEYEVFNVLLIANLIEQNSI